jgi:phosphoglycerate dehydrogenase-like enzyme
MTTVWLPFDPAPLGPLRDGLRVIVSGTNAPPEGYDEVTCLVVMNPAQTPYDLLPQMPQLRVLQTLSAGVEGVAERLPPGVTLCNGKGIHDAATAELTVAITLAAQRDLPT